MDRSSYSFLDYTVMPFLRKRVISSDAAVLFSADVSKVLWANAVGTRLFGGHAVIDLLDAGLSQTHPLVRQLANAARQIEDDEPIVRNFQISHGLKTETVRGEISRISLPNGEKAVLLSCPQDDPKHRYREHELATMSVESLDSFADAAAIIDEYGLILASSRQFDAFEIDPAMLETLVGMVAREDDRLVKRPIQAGNGETIAAGLGRIRDLPARFLVVLASAEPQEDESAGDVFEAIQDVPEAVPYEEEISDGELSGEIPPWVNAPEVETGRSIPLPPLPPYGISDDELPDDNDDALSSPEVGYTDDTIAATSETTSEGSLLDRWYFDKSGENEISGEPTNGKDQVALEEDQPKEVAPDEASAPVEQQETTPAAAATDVQAEPERFAFTIDADRIVRTVSPELIKAVGPVSGNIAGQSWEEISKARAFDEDGAINALLAKADTWSGRSVLWPIDETDMAVPIDLAALPVFGKERSFEGFRGFGIIRLADTVVDPAGRGMAIALGQTSDEFQNEDRDRENTDGNVGWRSDIEAEDRTAIATDEEASERATEDETPVRRSASGETTRPKPDKTQSDREEADTLEASEGSFDNDNGNIFHLPNFRTDKKPEQEEIDPNEALFSVPSDFGASDFGEPDEVPELSQDSGENVPGSIPELNGKEKRAFGEIRRSLTGVENETDGSADQKRTGSDENGNESPPDSEHSVLGSLPIPLLVYQASKTLFANEALLEQTGYESVEQLAEAGGIDKLLASDGESTGTSIRTKDGEVIPVRSRLTKVDWQGENALCLSFELQSGKGETGASTATAADEKTALDMMRVAELENILETAADGLLIIDGAGKIESLNAAGEALFEREQQDVVGKPFTSLFASESRTALEKHLEDLNTLGETSFVNQGQEVIGIEANGGLIPLFAMIGKVGNSGRYCAVLRDLTDWKKTEEELLEARRKAETANDQKSEFLSRVSHEIREPLTSIIGFSDVMIEERFGKIENERYREYLKDINRSGIHVLDLVNDLLDISKIEAGKLELSYEAVDLNQLAGETVALLQPKANNKRIIIRTSLSRAVPKVVADARSIRQIILNLVSNAIQHSHRNSQVIVSTTYEENGEVALRIRDTGSGMSEAELQRALEPFAQLGEDRMENPSGTGLGLPLTKALVEANRAYFELESEKGDGTIAHIQFPSQRVLAD